MIVDSDSPGGQRTGSDDSKNTNERESPPAIPAKPCSVREKGETAALGGHSLGPGFEIIRVREKHGQFRKAVPTMPVPLAIFCCILNVGLPGTGTIISAFASLCCPSEYEKKSEAFYNNMVASLLQIVTLIVLIGWIWSIYWGITFIAVAISKDEKEKEFPEPTKV